MSGHPKGTGPAGHGPLALFLMLLLALVIMLTMLSAPVRTARAAEEFVIVQGSGDPHLEFCKRILFAVFARLDKKVKVVRVPAERAILMASDGLVDGDCLRVGDIIHQYANLVQVPEALQIVSFTAYSLTVSELPEGWASLKPYRLAAPTGWKLVERRISSISPKQFLHVDDTETLFNLLALNRIDIGVANLVAGRQHLHGAGTQGGILPILPPLEVVPLFLTLNAKHARLIEPLADAIDDLKGEGVWREIYNQTFGQPPAK